MTESQINVEKEQTEQEVNIEREPFSVGGGGHDYTAGEGLKLQDYEFSADTDVLATKSDLSDKQDTLTAGENISIENNTISATDTTYTAGDNVSIENNTISATDTTYTAGDNITISEDNVISASGGGGGGPTVVQATGTSTTDVMSQKAATNMIYQSGYEENQQQIWIKSSYSPNYGVRIGGSGLNLNGSFPGTGIGVGAKASGNYAIAIAGSFEDTTASGKFSVAIGRRATATHDQSMALGYDSTTTRASEVSIGANGTTRYLSNVKDPQNNQDAATKKYVDSAIAALEARIAALEGN